jgi:hypothetical protein
MKKFTGLRLTLPTLHFDMSEVMQKRSVDMYETFLHNNDVMDAPRISDIADFLSLHNRTEIPFTLRHQRCHKLLEQIMFSAIDLQELLPHKELATLHTETCFSVKLLLLHVPASNTDLQQQYLHWLVFCLSQQIASQFANYHNEPKSLWGELHRVYQYVLDEKLETTTGYPLKPNIAQTYQAIVFFTAAEPYHLDATDARILLQWLRAWMPNDCMTRLTSQETSRHQFYVNLLENRGVLSDKRLHELLVQDHGILVAEPTALMAIAKSHINYLHANGSVDEIKIYLDVDNIDIICALKKALVSWGKITERKDVRIKSYESVELVVGLPYVLQILGSHVEHRPNAISGTAINNSKNGACIEISSKDIINANVGDIVNEQISASESFIGVVKWIRKTPDSAQMGIEYLLGNSHSVQTSITDHWVNGLFMQEGNNEVLLTRSGIYHSGQNLRIANHNHEKTVLANLGPLLNRFGNTDVFRVLFDNA